MTGIGDSTWNCIVYTPRCLGKYSFPILPILCIILGILRSILGILCILLGIILGISRILGINIFELSKRDPKHKKQ